MIDSLKLKSACLALGALMLIGTQVDAASVLIVETVSLNASAEQFDSGSYSPGFGGLTHTGRITLEDQSATNATIALEGGASNSVYMASPSNPIPGYTILDFSAELNFTSGQVASGSFSMTLNNSGGSTTETMTATAVFNSGTIKYFPIPTNPYYQVTASLENIVFSAPSFGGVNVSDFAFSPDGTLANFEFRPNASFIDTQASAKLLVQGTAVPTPGGLVAGGALLLCLAARSRARRRRRFAWHRYLSSDAVLK